MRRTSINHIPFKIRFYLFKLTLKKGIESESVNIFTSVRHRHKTQKRNQTTCHRKVFVVLRICILKQPSGRDGMRHSKAEMTEKYVGEGHKTVKHLHISCPRTQVSGRVFTSTSTVGVHTNNTSKSAMLKFVRKIFVEFRISLVFNITIGTCRIKNTKTR